MSDSRFLGSYYGPAVLVALVMTPVAAGRAAQEAEEDNKPLLRIESQGPLSYVTSLAFSPDGKTLYVGGWDKVVHVWRWDDAESGFVYRPRLAFRVPIGPGLRGAINAIRLSPDGRWLAVAGRGRSAGLAGFRDETAYVVPGGSMTPGMRLDEGRIFVFNTGTRQVRQLRGHNAPVVAMQFVDGPQGGLPLLVSAAQQIGRRNSDGEPRPADAQLRPGTATFETSGSIRLWNIETTNTVAELRRVPVPDPNRPRTRWPWDALPDPGGWRPDLAAWRVGPNLQDVRVAVAWGDNNPDRTRGMFRVWDPKSGRVTTPASATYPLIAATLTGGRNGSVRILSGGHREIGTWTVPERPDGTLPVLSHDRHFSRIGDRLNRRHLPKAVTLFASDSGELVDRAAVVVEDQSGEAVVYDLLVVDVEAGRVLRQVPLWSGPARDPAIAASPHGRFLAVAGNQDDSVRIYATAELTQQGDEVRIVDELRGRGTSWRQIEFVRNGNDRGLQVREPFRAGSEPDSSPPPSLTFDISNRTVIDAPDGWSADTPDPAGWTTEYRADAAATVIIQNGQPYGRVVLPDDHELTAQVLCPPTEHCPVALLALATSYRGEPRLSLYDARTGNELRRFNGHLEGVRDVAFSGDGRMLASVSSDRTIRVWWTADIDDTRNKLGRVSGLAVTEQGGSLRVTGMVSDSRAADAGLRVGDVIRAVKTGNDRATFESRWPFYQFLSATTPGTQVEFEVVRGGNVSDRTVTIEQGIDQRNPLFSLFFAEGEGAWNWIGWHPIGPYEVSDREAERYLGWHFNTSQPDSPTRFASAEEYRDNRDDGLLKRLIEQGPSGVARPPEPLPDPDMNVSLLDSAGRLVTSGYEDLQLVRRTDLTVNVQIEQFPAERIASVECQLDDGEAVSLDRDASGFWTADLSMLTWKRGRHSIRVTLHPTGRESAFESRPLSLMFLPPAPEVSFDDQSAPPAETDEKELTFNATVTGASFSGEAIVELWHNDRQHQTWTKPADKPLQIEQSVTLTEGANTLTLLARNAAALTDFADYETGAVVRRVRYQKPGPPVIEITGVRKIGSDRDLRSTVEKPDGGESGVQRVIVSDVPRVRILAKIQAPDPLRDVRIFGSEDTEDDAEQGRQPMGFAPGRNTAIEFDEEVALQPGRQTIRLRAVTTRNQKAEESLDLRYRPQLPSLVRLTVQTDGESVPVSMLPGETLDLYAGRHPRTVTLNASLKQPDDPHSARAVVLLNGSEVGDPLDIAPEQELLSRNVTLRDGENVLQFRLNSQWNEEGVRTPSITVTYRRPPRIAEVESHLHENRPFTDLKVRVTSDEGLPVNRLVVEVSGVSVPQDSITLRRDPGDKAAWIGTVHEVPLDEGTNRIAIVAHNADGSSKRHTIEETPPPPPPKPEIVFVSPAVDEKVTASVLRVQFNVTSTSRLSRVDLVTSSPRSGERQQQRHQLLEGLEGPDALNRYAAETTVRLQPDMNELTVEAVNEGGRSIRSLRVNVVTPPIRIVADRVVPQNEPDTHLHPRVYRPEGIRLDHAAPGGHVTVHGHVQWPSLSPAERRRSRTLRVWVNGFLKLARVDATGPQAESAPFRVSVVLNRENNEIELEHPRLPDQYDTPRLLIRCSNPERRQHLHLVMIGVQKDPQASVDPETIESRARQALESQGASHAFQEIEPYGPLAGPEATGGRIKALLMSVVSRIRARRSQNGPNDVVFIYYHGKEVLGASGEFLLADFRNWHDPTLDRSAISSGYLSEVLNGMPGAHLVLLDVNHAGRKPSRKWARDPHLGLLRVDVDEKFYLLAALQQSMSIPGNVHEVRLKHVVSNLAIRLQDALNRPLLDSHVPTVMEDLLLGRIE